LTVKSGDDVYIEGSSINAGSASFETGGNFTETSAKETSYEYSFHEKITGNINLNVIAHPLSEIDYNNGRLSATVVSGEYNKHEQRTDLTLQKSSNISIENDITINSGKDITVAGSNLTTNVGDISLTAVDNVSIIVAYEKTKTIDSETKGTIDLSVGVKNAATDVYYAGKAVKDAEKALADARSSYEDFKKQLALARDNVDKGLMDQADYDMMESEKHYYEANIALCTENLAAKTAALCQAMAGAASSSGVLGFSADAQIDIDALVTKTMSENVSAVSSTITSGGSLTINAGKKADIIGSDVSAGDTIALNAKTVAIEAAKNTSSSITSESNAHVTITFSTSTGAGINASASDTESCTDSISYTNSHLNAANIIINSTADTTVKGGVVTAENSLKLDIGGDLTVESLQDKSENSLHTIGVSMSGGNSSSGGANGKISSGNKRWVTEQTSLTGGNVDIYVEDKTTLKGAVIASTANDLNLDTGSVEYSNIFDSKKSTSIGGGVSGSGIGSTNGASSSANINYSLSNSTQVNIATIGEGNITVRDGGSTDKLNRDTTATQIITSDTGMKGGATVDSDTINLLTTNPVTTVDNAIDSAAGIAFKAITDGANVVNDTMVVAEKTGNLVEYKHFTTDDKVQYYKNIDNYAQLLAEGKKLSISEKLDYYNNKEAVREPLTIEERGEREMLAYIKKEEVLRSQDSELTSRILEETGWDGTKIANTKNQNVIDQTNYLQLKDAGLPEAYGPCVFFSTVYGTADALGFTLTPSEVGKVYKYAKEHGVIGFDSKGNHSEYYVNSYPGLIDAVAAIKAVDASNLLVSKKQINCSPNENNEKVTKDIINALQSGGSAQLRFGGHSMRVESVSVDENGDIIFHLRDTVAPKTETFVNTKDMKLYKKYKDGRISRDNRSLTHYLTITKKTDCAK